VKHCIKIHSHTKSGEKMRPSATGQPSQHWTSLLADQYQQNPELSIIWNDGQDREIHITKEFWRQCEYGFEHVMQFIRMHDLDYTICHTECAKCKGHSACVSMDRPINAVA
jgi:hypothetical protein